MIPCERQDISLSDIEAVVEVLQSDFRSQGPVPPRFEQAVADYCGPKHVVAVNSAPAAINLPMFLTMTKAQQDQVIAALGEELRG